MLTGFSRAYRIDTPKYPAGPSAPDRRRTCPPRTALSSGDWGATVVLWRPRTSPSETSVPDPPNCHPRSAADSGQGRPAPGSVPAVGARRQRHHLDIPPQDTTRHEGTPTRKPDPQLLQEPRAAGHFGRTPSSSGSRARPSVRGSTLAPTRTFSAPPDPTRARFYWPEAERTARSPDLPGVTSTRTDHQHLQTRHPPHWCLE